MLDDTRKRTQNSSARVPFMGHIGASPRVRGDQPKWAPTAKLKQSLPPKIWMAENSYEIIDVYQIFFSRCKSSKSPKWWGCVERLPLVTDVSDWCWPELENVNCESEPGQVAFQCLRRRNLEPRGAQQRRATSCNGCLSASLAVPICSMYGIFTNICPKNHPVL